MALHANNDTYALSKKVETLLNGLTLTFTSKLLLNGAGHPFFHFSPARGASNEVLLFSPILY